MTSSPLSALRATSPEGGSKICLCEEAKRRSNLLGGRISARYMLRTFSVGYFADAQYDVKKEKYVILNDSEESHDLSEEYMLRTFSAGYFSDAQYNLLFNLPLRQIL